MALTAPPRPHEPGGVGSLHEVATAADLAAKQASERYQNSLEVLKAALAKLKLIEPEFGAHGARLDELECRVAGLRDEISDFSRQAREKQKAAAASLLAAATFVNSVRPAASAEPPFAPAIRSRALLQSDAEPTVAGIVGVTRVPSFESEPGASATAECKEAAPEAPKAQLTVCLEDSPTLPVVALRDVESSESSTASRAYDGVALEASHASYGSTVSLADQPILAAVGGEQLQQPNSLKKVTFRSGDDGQSASSEICHFDVLEFVGNEPVHGHWLPDEVRQRRPSFENASELAKRLGGRMVSFETEDDEDCECVLVEPMGKILSPAEYVSTGVVIVVLGAESVEETQEEWERVLSKTKWLDAGLSVALPDLEPGCGSERSRLEASVNQCTKLVGVEKCLLVGKGWGASLAVEVAAAGSVTRRLAGMLLVAPGELIEQACGRLDTAAFLLWARDDEVSEFREVREWAQAMHRWKGPTYTKEVSSGGHDIAKLLEEKGVAQAFLHFASVAMLVTDLLRLASRLDEGQDVAPGASPLLEGTVRLCDELPSYLVGILGGSSKDDEQEGGVASTLSQQAQGRHGSKNLRRAVARLQDWIACGLQQVASATE